LYDDILNNLNLHSMPVKLQFILVFILLTSCSLVETEVALKAGDVSYVYDGDTITFHCIDGFQCEHNKTKVRVKGVDTPELKAECKKERDLARLAKQHTVRLLRDANKITLFIDKTSQYDRYHRLLAYVYIDGIGLHDSLIKRDLGRDYQGGKRVDWC
jgi:endonuclease YncB( thermonuclease family)